jgi:formylglycine-generating enzyme required for sulfatase activity
LKVWDTDSGKLLQTLQTLQVHSGAVKCVALTPDGKRAISGSDDKTLKVWDTDSGKLLRTFQGHSRYVYCVALTPDGKRAISGSYDRTLKVWDTDSGKLLQTLQGHSGYVSCVALTPDGKRAISGSGDNTLKVWDIFSGKLLATYELDDTVYGIAINPDGKTVIAGGGSGRVHKLTMLLPGETNKNNTSPENSNPTVPKPKPAIDDKTLITNSIGMKLKLISAGEFLMGSPQSEKNRGSEEQQHRVRISESFYMQTTEVTQGQWKSVMGTEPWKGKTNVKEGPDYAASYLNWDDATEYCRKLSAKEGRKYRLPTEAEWEYACRAGSASMYNFGDTASRLGDYAWYDKNASDVDEKYAHRVGLKKPNTFGLYDMHGNVYEWCQDWHIADYYGKSPAADPRGPASGSSRILRGGAWDYDAQRTRSADRFRYAPSALRYFRFYCIGFRVVCELD